jgi:hypothetical protein
VNATVAASNAARRPIFVMEILLFYYRGVVSSHAIPTASKKEIDPFKFLGVSAPLQIVSIRAQRD